MDAFEAIKAGLDKWREYSAPEGVDRNARGVNFEGFAFTDYELVNCDFEQSRFVRCTFAGTKLVKAKLKGSNWVGANLSGLYAEESDFSNVNFNKATIAGARFVRCNFTGVSFTVNMQECTFEDCTFHNGGLTLLMLNNVSFKDSRLIVMNCDKLTGNRVNFEGATIDGSRMEDMTLTDSTFAGATIQGTPLTRLKATSSDPKTPCINFEGTKFKGNVNLSQAQIPSANFKSCVSESLQLFEATVPKSDFTDARICNSSIGRASLLGSTFTRADLRGTAGNDTQLQGSTFDDANLGGCNIGGCDFSNCSLQRANLTSCDLKGANLEGADMRGAAFFSTQLAGARVRGARITRSDFDDIRLHNYWGLRESQLRGMSVEDDFAKARMQFSGFWSWYHSLVTLAWLFPLLWIVLRSFLLSFMPKSAMAFISTDISLWGQLWGYIVSGRMYARAIPEAPHWSYDLNVFHCVTFILMAAYNVVRMYMLYIVKRNELQYTVSGLQPVYADEGRNWWQLRIVKYGAYVYSVFTFFHVIRFLSQEYPALIK